MLPDNFEKEYGVDIANIQRNLQKAGAIEGRISVWSPTKNRNITLCYKLQLQTYEFTLERG